MLSITLPADTAGNVTRCTSKSSKVERITDTKLGKVRIDLGGVDGLSSKTAIHLLCWDALVVEIRFRANLETMGLACNSLEQCRAPRSGVFQQQLIRGCLSSTYPGGPRTHSCSPGNNNPSRSRKISIFRVPLPNSDGSFSIILPTVD